MLSFLPLSVIAQDDFEHLLENRKLSFSIMGGPVVEFSGVHQNFGFSSGGAGAILLNQKLFFGGYGLRLAPVIGKDVTVDGVDYNNLEIDFNHGGIWLGYIHNYKKLVHMGGSVKFGWGSIELADGRLTVPYVDNVLVITPQVDVEVNITRWFKINAGGGYRFVTSINEDVFQTNDFNSPTLTIGLMVGWFRGRN